MMKIMKNKYLLYSFSFLLILTLIFSFSNESSNAEDISFREAVKIGLENNSEIKDIKNSIKTLERSREKIYSQKDWQLDLSGSYKHYFNEEESQASEISVGDAKESASGESISLSASKLYDFDLSFNPTLTVDEENESLAINLTQKLYPITESDFEKKLYDNQKELIKTKAKLENLKADKIISWSESYLNIIRMEESEEMYQESVKKAEDNLKKIKKEEKIGEAGEQQILTAEYSLEDAKYKLKEQNFKLNESKSSFKNQLGVSEAKEIEFKAENKLIVDLKEKADSLTADYLENDNLIEVIEANNNSLKANKIDREILKKELAKLKKEDNMKVDLSGDYNTSTENLSATLNFNYNLYDGGQHELDLEAKKEAIDDNINDYKKQYSKLKLDLESHLNTLSLNKDNLHKQKLNYKRSENKLKIDYMKYEKGVIDYLAYQETWISTKETELSLDSIKDAIFIDKLQFISFVNSENVIGGF